MPCESGETDAQTFPARLGQLTSPRRNFHRESEAGLLFMDYIQKLNKALQSCPFCGEQAKIITADGGDSFWIECDGDCACNFGRIEQDPYSAIGRFETSDAAAKAWNYRAGQPIEK